MFEIRTEPLTLASIRAFAPGLLIDVDLFVPETREVAVDSVPLVHPFAKRASSSSTALVLSKRHDEWVARL